ncbi:hypothetical protein [Paraburkholderia caledonica]|uniref:Uncharacterized protein n=1 Tax=Paraburkholderia caledonica TaxID=134536 RepID=A0AB73IPB7_9BURK|nr:hypothetical protein [Paraburkholderia caledonica]
MGDSPHRGSLMVMKHGTVTRLAVAAIASGEDRRRLCSAAFLDGDRRQRWQDRQQSMTLFEINVKNERVDFEFVSADIGSTRKSYAEFFMGTAGLSGGS